MGLGSVYRISSVRFLNQEWPRNRNHIIRCTKLDARSKQPQMEFPESEPANPNPQIASFIFRDRRPYQGIPYPDFWIADLFRFNPHQANLNFQDRFHRFDFGMPSRILIMLKLPVWIFKKCSFICMGITFQSTHTGHLHESAISGSRIRISG